MEATRAGVLAEAVINSTPHFVRPFLDVHVYFGEALGRTQKDAEASIKAVMREVPGTCAFSVSVWLQLTMTCMG